MVHGYEARDHTDTETGKDTTDDEEWDGDGSGLHGYTDAENDASGNDTHPTTEIVCHRSGQEGTEKGTSGEDGDDQGFVCGRNGVFL